MEPEYKKILQDLYESHNFEFDAYKSSMLIRRIKNRMNRLGCPNTESYHNIIRNCTEEKDKLMDNFMINVSHFFRNPLVFEYINKFVIPELFNAQNKKNSLRVWSAGCSQGEEPYSLAILLQSFFDKEKIKPELQFFATDSDEQVLSFAKLGLYQTTSLNETKLQHLQRYFSRSSSGYQLKDEIKSMVNFSNDNLLDKNNYAPKESIFGDFDLILCRNVLIYFNAKYHNIVFDKLYKSLSTNGYVVLGESESIPNKYKNKFVQVNNCCNIFRRIN